MSIEPRPLLFNHNIQGRVEHLRRSAAAVLKKIQKVYGLSDEEVALPADVPRTLPADKQTEWNTKWTKRCNEQSDACGITGNLRKNKIQAWTKKGEEIIQRYQQGFHVRGQVITHLHKVTDEHYKPYRSIDNGRGLVAIYINHLTNLASAELMELGINKEGAHKLNGTLMCNSMHRFESAYNYVQPNHSPLVPIEEEIAKVGSYWQHRTAKLAAAHRANTERLF